MKKIFGKRFVLKHNQCKCGGELYLKHCMNCFTYYGYSKKKHEIQYQRSKVNYIMPVCKDCNFCNPMRGHFGCILVPIILTKQKE